MTRAGTANGTQNRLRIKLRRKKPRYKISAKKRPAKSSSGVPIMTKKNVLTSASLNPWEAMTACTGISVGKSP